METHFADRLCNAVREKKAPVCIGLDPVVDRFPDDLLSKHGIPRSADGNVPTDTPPKAVSDAILEFGTTLIGAVASFVPAVKINIAFFEPYRAEGVQVYFDLVKTAHKAGLIVIGDVKRADIGHSSARYASAHLGEGDRDPAAADTPDAITIKPYFGWDGVKPFIELASKAGRGVFVLVQTSNESAAQVQGLTLSDGAPVCHRVAQLVQTWATAENRVGASGYSCVGAVVSPRDLPSTERIRTLMPNCIFLVPGFGAQGRTADEVAKCFRPDGAGAIVTASRSVMYAYQTSAYRDRFGDDWGCCIQEACKDFVAAVRNVLPI